MRGRKAGLKMLNYHQLERDDQLGRSAKDIERMVNIIRGIRQREGVTQSAFATMLGYTAPTYLNRVENGAFPSPEFVRRLALISDISDTELAEIHRQATSEWAFLTQ